MSLLYLSLLSLGLMLAVARVVDRRKQREIEDAMSATLSVSARGVLEYFELILGDQRVGVSLGTAALRERDQRLLRAAVVSIEGHAPNLLEGLRALRVMARAASVLVAPPPIFPLVWRAWSLRGLTACAAVVHGVLVLGVERVRLRLWLLSRAFVFSSRTLTRGAARVRGGHDGWREIAVAVHDLDVVSNETTATYECVVRSLDAVGEFSRSAA